MSERIPKKARREEGRETEFTIPFNEDPKDIPNLSRANYGNISRVTARIERGTRVKERGLVIKHSHGGDDWNWEGTTSHGGNVSRDRSLDAYNILKSIGIRHLPPTFRAIGKSEVVMTDFNRHDKLAIAWNKIKESRSEKIESFTNFPEAIEGMRQDLIKASVYGIRLGGDAFFAIVPKQGKDIPIEMVIGDLDGISIREFGKSVDINQIQKLYRQNVSDLRGFFVVIQQNNDFFASEEYPNSLAAEVVKLLDTPDIATKIEEYLR